jgi:pimeloyl-ACP methyl ester carboxylesterase
MNATVEGRIQLRDGRSLDTYVSGDEHAPVLIFHHGTPSARVPVRVIERSVHQHGLRFVTWSRPGYGDSTPQPGRQVVDVVSDVEQILDGLGVNRCMSVGWSGGGPHSLACGARLADRVTSVLVIAGVGPYGADGLDFLEGMGQGNLDEFGAVLDGEDTGRAFLDAARPGLMEATGPALAEEMSSILPDIDKRFLTGEVGDDLASNFREAVRAGVEGWLEDDLAFIAPWGFELSEIGVPVHLWQGSEDLMVPFAHGVWLAEQIPNVTAHLEQGEGHVSIGIGAIDRMLDEVLSST